MESNSEALGLRFYLRFFGGTKGRRKGGDDWGTGTSASYLVIYMILID